MTDAQAVTCPLCRRPLDGTVTRHHLYPQKYGKKKGRKTYAKEFPVLTLHKICHRMIHALFSEKYLAEHLNTMEALRAHPAMQPFLQFIEDKPRASMCACEETKKRSKEIGPQYCRGSSPRPFPTLYYHSIDLLENNYPCGNVCLLGPSRPSATVWL